MFYKEYESDNDTSGDDGDASQTRCVARATPVFSAEQVDGFTAEPIGDTIIDPIDTADALVRSTGTTIRHGGSRAEAKGLG